MTPLAGRIGLPKPAAATGPGTLTRSANAVQTMAGGVFYNGADWSNPTNALGATDGAVASAALPAEDSSDYLGFGFDLSALPDGATVNGLSVVVRCRRQSASGFVQAIVRWTKTGTAVVGAVKALPTAGTYLSGTLADYTAGGPADLWALSWTVAELKAASLRLCLQMGNADTSTVGCELDSVTLTVHYTV